MTIHLKIQSIDKDHVVCDVILDGKPKAGTLHFTKHEYECVAAMIMNARAAEIDGIADPLTYDPPNPRPISRPSD